MMMLTNETAEGAELLLEETSLISKADA